MFQLAEKTIKEESRDHKKKKANGGEDSLGEGAGIKLSIPPQLTHLVLKVHSGNSGALTCGFLSQTSHLMYKSLPTELGNVF